MPFNMTPNVAQYGGADWSNLVTRISGSTPQSAQRVAMSNPDITFFFYCREPMYLDGQGQFLPGDSVFFSGQPWPGSAPQCDIYQKDFFNVAYVEVNSNNFANAGCYTLADGRQFFDIASIFAANINAGQDGAVLYFNISKALFSDLTYFNSTWNGMTLAQQLSYGWEMYYGGGDCNTLLTPYVTAGMGKPQLGTGVSTSSTGSSMTKQLTQCTKNNQYGGMMVYNVTSDSQAFLSIISQAMYGQDTVAKANCLV